MSQRTDVLLVWGLRVYGFSSAVVSAEPELHVGKWVGPQGYIRCPYTLSWTALRRAIAIRLGKIICLYTSTRTNHKWKRCAFYLQHAAAGLLPYAMRALKQICVYESHVLLPPLYAMCCVATLVSGTRSRMFFAHCISLILQRFWDYTNPPN